MPPRAHPLVGFVFGAAAGLAILLTGPLLLFAPPAVSLMQARHQVAQRLGTDQASVDRATASMLADLVLAGDFGVSLDGNQSVLDAAERSHMRDVGAVVRRLLLADALALLIVALAGRRLAPEPRRRGRLLLAAAASIAGAALVLGAFFTLSFDAAFAAFHAIFFQPGTWQFGADSNLLRFFPQPFWFEVALLAGATIMVGALVAALVAWRDLGRPVA